MGAMSLAASKARTSSRGRHRERQRRRWVTQPSPILNPERRLLQESRSHAKTAAAKTTLPSIVCRTQENERTPSSRMRPNPTGVRRPSQVYKTGRAAGTALGNSFTPLPCVHPHARRASQLLLQPRRKLASHTSQTSAAKRGSADCVEPGCQTAIESGCAAEQPFRSD